MYLDVTAQTIIASLGAGGAAVLNLFQNRPGLPAGFGLLKAPCTRGTVVKLTCQFN